MEDEERDGRDGGAHRLELRPIGFARTPHAEKADAPRQPMAARDVEATVEILPTYRDALQDLEGFDRVFLIFGFDRAPRTTHLKVQPPRSAKKRGVLATRSPHRPNPIGLSVVRLLRVEGLVLHIADVDLLDGTPIYDIKPYLAYTDAFPDARAGWLDEEGAQPAVRERERERDLPLRDPLHAFNVTFRAVALEACAFIEARTGLALERRAREHLALGPEPHAYRRIRVEGDVSVLAVKDWRVVFVADREARSIEVISVRSGYSPQKLASSDPSLEVHRDLGTKFRS